MFVSNRGSFHQIQVLCYLIDGCSYLGTYLCNQVYGRVAPAGSLVTRLLLLLPSRTIN